MKPISFIIITYNRVHDTLELLKNVSSLNRAAELLQDVIVVNNASADDYGVVKAYISETPGIPFKFIDANENLGVTKGRNYALKFAQGEIVIFLDDDAVLQNADALENVLTAFDQKGFEARPVAIVSFKVLYYDTLEMQKNALPHKNFERYKDLPDFFTYYFAGGAHAIKRSVLNEVGDLPAAFFYGMEEYDLSYRIIEKGYCIRYDSSIVMLHKESPLGRKPKSDKQRMMWVNKTKVAWRYLPKRYFYSTAIMWSFEYLRKVGLDPAGWLRGWKLVLQVPRTERRTPLKAPAIRYLREVGARLWY
ncbi:glycosyltransferase family 2 protein [Segetibacter sp. 3557_3]|uniref:glycosyltransferase family 2 protein n=1 Tax=Segetibacter sp. 3557_3 TaxID=2547429 RepID=UPI0010590B26|nr:glycosyltransferase family 2 protein [Segetibacter sp. 3557_3]TDH28844.1 glycosyltransferase family 2 protein [Segetibacter sp. 3557_3]